ARPSMRKRIIDDDRRSGLPVAQRWLDLERIAEVEVTSEADAHPIEAALIPGEHARSEEHTSELQSRENLVCRLLLEKKKCSVGFGPCACNPMVLWSLRLSYPSPPIPTRL